MWETRRKKNPASITDLMDSPRWKRLAGPPTATLTRIMYDFCVDGFPWGNRKHQGSLKPSQILFASLPPWMRYKEKYIIVQMLVPPKLKGAAAKKYYDWAAEFEMNKLCNVGVDGVKLKLYGSSLDCPGRRELLDMQAVTAKYPCPHCLHTWQPGLRWLVYAGYRSFLHVGHPWRAKSFTFKGHKFEYRDVEARPPPIRRTDALVARMLERARPGRPCCGHKGPPFLSNWDGADWGRSMCDVMHDIKCFCECIVKTLVGKGRDGVYQSWGTKDEQHRRTCQAFGMFKDFADGTVVLPPWRLTREQVILMDRRVRRMWWPHYTDKLVRDGQSFWMKPDRMWKAKHKWLCLMTILPTCLNGCVPAVHLSLVYIVSALRGLMGQVYSVMEAKARGEEACTRSLDKDLIDKFGQDLIHGLVMLEGSTPIDQLNPAAHHLVHYAEQTREAGILLWLALNTFERSNRRLKNLVRNNQAPASSLANNIQVCLQLITSLTALYSNSLLYDLQVDMATRLLSCQEDLADEGPPPLSELKGSSSYYIPSRAEKFVMGLCGVTDFTHVSRYHIARVQGTHFKSGEWSQRRCGSVFVSTHCGQSRYGIINKFLGVQGKAFAAVSWLSPCAYPFAPITLLVKTKMVPDADQPRHRCVILLDEIEPTGVCVLPDEDGIHFWMMRLKGSDRRLP